jgi:hypothetical protein
MMSARIGRGSTAAIPMKDSYSGWTDIVLLSTLILLIVAEALILLSD